MPSKSRTIHLERLTQCEYLRCALRGPGPRHTSCNSTCALPPGMTPYPSTNQAPAEESGRFARPQRRGRLWPSTQFLTERAVDVLDCVWGRVRCDVPVDVEIGIDMRPRPQTKLEHEHPLAASRETWLHFLRARDHWVSCEHCRNAASASASQWCELGLQLMKAGVVTNPHWDTCRRCQDAQASVRSNQCSRGRDLDDEYRLASQRFAASLGDSAAPGGIASASRRRAR
jgi:hypothetical protein